MFGQAAYDLRPGDENLSPKARVPSLEGAFHGFAEANGIVANNFTVVGSLSVGGLSNTWGCGVAAFDNEELSHFPFPGQELAAAYGRVSAWMGISGACNDDLADYFGVDNWADPAFDLDANHEWLWQRYSAIRSKLNSDRFSLGRARVAVLRTTRGERRPCTEDGLCLWGCAKGALFSSRYEFAELTRHANVTAQLGVVVERFARTGDEWQVIGRHRDGSAFRASARVVILAAGTLATSAIVLRSTNSIGVPLRLLSSPMGAFLVWLPARLGAAPCPGVGFAQLSFAARLEESSRAGPCFGNLFSTTGLPVTDFLRHVPISVSVGADILRFVLPSSVVGNFFLPGEYSSHTVELLSDGSLSVTGGLRQDAFAAMRSLKQFMSKTFRSLGAVLVPGSFKIGAVGGDVHYAGTLPMRRNPRALECDPHGQLNGLSGVYVVDGASLPPLPAKAHTLTIMANADRIGRALSKM